MRRDHRGIAAEKTERFRDARNQIQTVRTDQHAYDQQSDDRGDMKAAQQQGADAHQGDEGDEKDQKGVVVHEIFRNSIYLCF